MQITHHPAWQYLWPLATGAVVFFLGLLVRPVLFARLKRWPLLQSVHGPFILWCLILAIQVTILLWPVTDEVRVLAGKSLSVLWLISLTLVGLRLADQTIQRYGDRLAAALPLTSLTQNLTKAIILVIGALMALNSVGISITPILTALGVGGLAVALALQETLSNLFAGIYITMARRIRVGDYVKLESGEEGYVTDISWRSTQIGTLSGNLIIIPNTKLGQAIVTNFDLPNKDLAVLVEVGVAYGSDLEKAERVTSEVGKEVMQQVPGGVPEFQPFIRYHTLGPYSVNFTAILRAKSFVDQYLVKHEFVKRLQRRYAQEGIRIPFPTQVTLRPGD